MYTTGSEVLQVIQKQKYKGAINSGTKLHIIVTPEKHEKIFVL
jgi:hypothetical protein